MAIPVERGYDPKGRLKVLDGLLRLALRMMYAAKDTVAVADRKLFIFIREVNRPRYGFFCGVELVVVVQQRSELLPRSCFFRYFFGPFVGIRCFLHLVYPFFVEVKQPILVGYRPQCLSDLEVTPCSLQSSKAWAKNSFSSK